MSDELITLQELGRRLGYPPSTIRDMYARGNFPAEIEVKGRPKLTRFIEADVRDHLRPKKKAAASLA